VTPEELSRLSRNAWHAAFCTREQREAGLRGF
jgi:adenosine deaminase